MFEIVVKVALVHTLTYFLVGFTAFVAFRYEATLSHPRSNMRPATDPRVRAGVLFQPVRGALFGLVVYLLRGVLLIPPHGWLTMWLMFVGVGIVGTFAPAASSLEGLIYLQRGIGTNWGGLLEMLLQSFLLSLLSFHWIVRPTAWLSWTLPALFTLAMLLPTLGLLAKAPRGTAREHAE